MRKASTLIAVAVLLAGCAGGITTKRTVVETERIACPPALLDVECPETPLPRSGDTWDDYVNRVEAFGTGCRAALTAWEEAYLDLPA